MPAYAANGGGMIVLSSVHTMPAGRQLAAVSSCRQKMEYDEEPKLLAIDCEMCATAGDDKALLSLCMVDTDGTSILHVRPPLPAPSHIPSLPGPIDRSRIGFPVLPTAPMVSCPYLALLGARVARIGCLTVHGECAGDGEA